MLVQLVIVLLIALAILISGSVTTTLRVPDFGSAVLMAVAMGAIEWLLSSPTQSMVRAFMTWVTGSAHPTAHPTGWWASVQYVLAGFALIENSVVFLVLTLFVPRVTVRGLPGPSLAIGLITIIQAVMPQALAQSGIVF